VNDNGLPELKERACKVNTAFRNNSIYQRKSLLES
jgi:hypothetical protein